METKLHGQPCKPEMVSVFKIEGHCDLALWEPIRSVGEHIVTEL